MVPMTRGSLPSVVMVERRARVEAWSMKNQQKQQKTEFNGVLNPRPTAAEEKSAPVAWKPAVGEAWVDLINNLQASSGSDTKPLLDLQRLKQLIDAEVP